MTTLQDKPQSQQARPFANAYAQGGGDVAARQSQQQGREAREANDRQQSAQEEETFTVSVDDWFKA